MFLIPPMNILVLAGLMFIVLTAVRAASVETGSLPPAGLRCEYLIDPLGVDTPHPRFFWVPAHTDRGKSQSAYQILVSHSPGAPKGEVWDSGKTASSRFIHIVFNGKPLRGASTYYWKVRWWDETGAASPWSEAASFDTGLFDPEDWRPARWIGGANQLRREFAIEGTIVRARAYVCGLGYHELRVNGRKAGTSVLDPAWTTYDKRALYVVYDIGPLLRSGPNVLGVLLGNGWYKGKALLLKVVIETSEGRTTEIVSNRAWKVRNGPITADSVYDGETYDARLEVGGWDEPGMTASGWKSAEFVPGPKGVLSSQSMPPIRVVDTVVPVSMANPRPKVYVFDMGQNFSGWVRLSVSGPRGTEIRLRHSELLYPDGMVNVENLRSARAEDVYILKGGRDEAYEPRFTYHGFRYVEVTGYPGVPTLSSIRGRVVHSDVAAIGAFTGSHPGLQGLQRIITWGQKTNLHGIPTDCCQRDERMGWLGDAQGTAEEAVHNFDMAAFYANFLRDISDVQDEEGRITDTVPHVWGNRPADPAWGAAYPILAWTLYLYYGDERILEAHYEGLKRYAGYLRSRAEDGLVTFSSYGDWVAVDDTPGALVSSIYDYYGVRILADAARVLGKTGESEAYDRLAGEIKTAFHEAYYDPRTRGYASNTQTANALPLFLDLVPEALKGGVWQNLFNDLAYRNDSHLTTGIMGTKAVMEVLSAFGNADLAYDIAVQTTYPSWGYMLANGATTLWELWQRREGPSMNSHNHPMFGSVGAWLYKTLAGINLDPRAPGYEKIRLEPKMVRDLISAAGSVDTIRGRVACLWSRTPKSVRLEAVVPVGSDAEIVIPMFNLKDVVLTESGTAVWRQGASAALTAGLRAVVEKRGSLIVGAGSGRYVFELIGR